MSKPLKKWNGRAWRGGKHLPLCAAAYSRADLVRMLHDAGFSNITSGYIRDYWAPCWGSAMERQMPVPYRGAWIVGNLGDEFCTALEKPDEAE